MNNKLINTFFERSGFDIKLDMRDFSDFPPCPWIKRTNMHPLVFNNRTAIGYYSADDLPDGIRYIEQLKNKWVEYMLFFKVNGGMPYIGSTGDFGERMFTHDKDGRIDKRDLYELMRAEDRFIIKILGVFENEKECRAKEKADTWLYRELVGEMVLNQSIHNYTESEIKDKTRPFLLNRKVG